MKTTVEVKKVDARGRLVLPGDWRRSELSETKDIIIIKRKNYLKLIPKQHIDLTENFDKLDLGADSIADWKQFQKASSSEEGQHNRNLHLRPRLPNNTRHNPTITNKPENHCRPLAASGAKHATPEEIKRLLDESRHEDL